MNEELLSTLRYELGDVVDWEELCPGVYYLGVQPVPDSVYPCSEYYLVLPGAPISREALALGTRGWVLIQRISYSSKRAGHRTAG